MCKQEMWSVALELCRLSQRDTLLEAVRSLGILTDVFSEPHIREVTAWRRAGAETYLYIFALLHGGLERKFTLKAMVAPTPASPPEQQLEIWCARRARLKAFEVPVPRLYAAAHGVLLEDYIQDSAIEILQREPHIRRDLIAGLERLSDNVDRAGFQPRSILPETRWDGADFVWVDFGEDLGHFGASSDCNARPSRTVLFTELQRYL
jgi:hypothetical protein